MSAPITPITSVHFNIGHGVHADYKGLDKWHIPYEGQTTLPTFKICGEPGPENDKNLRELGGKLIWDLRTRE